MALERAEAVEAGAARATAKGEAARVTVGPGVVLRYMIVTLISRHGLRLASGIVESQHVHLKARHCHTRVPVLVHDGGGQIDRRQCAPRD